MRARMAPSSLPQSVIIVPKKVSQRDHLTTCRVSTRDTPSHATVLLKCVLPKFKANPTDEKASSTAASMICTSAVLLARSTTSTAHATAGNPGPSIRYSRPHLVQDSYKDAGAISATRMNRKSCPWAFGSAAVQTLSLCAIASETQTNIARLELCWFGFCPML